MMVVKRGGAATRGREERVWLATAECKSNRVMESRGKEEHKHYSGG